MFQSAVGLFCPGDGKKITFQCLIGKKHEQCDPCLITGVHFHFIEAIQCYMNAEVLFMQGVTMHYKQATTKKSIPTQAFQLV